MGIQTNTCPKDSWEWHDADAPTLVEADSMLAPMLGDHDHDDGMVASAGDDAR